MLQIGASAHLAVTELVPVWHRASTALQRRVWVHLWKFKSSAMTRATVEVKTQRKRLCAFQHLSFKWVLLADFQRLPKQTGPMPVHSYKHYLKSDIEALAK